MAYGGLTLDNAITLYFEKHDALKRGDLTKLRELQNNYPQIFLEKVEQEIRSVLDYIAKLKRDPNFQRRYKEHCKQKTKRNLSIVSNEIL